MVQEREGEERPAMVELKDIHWEEPDEWV